MACLLRIYFSSDSLSFQFKIFEGASIASLSGEQLTSESIKKKM